MAERPETPDDNPFRAYSARNVLSRARERIQLVRHWLIRHDPPENGPKPGQSADPDKKR
jgi:hypothetical protein